MAFSGEGGLLAVGFATGLVKVVAYPTMKSMVEWRCGAAAQRRPAPPTDVECGAAGPPRPLPWQRPASPLDSPLHPAAPASFRTGRRAPPSPPAPRLAQGVRDLDFARDPGGTTPSGGPLLATMQDNGACQLWDVRARQEVCSLALPRGEPGEGGDGRVARVEHGGGGSAAALLVHARA